MNQKCETCSRKYCDIKNQYINGCNSWLSPEKRKYHQGSTEIKYSAVWSILATGIDFTIQEVTALTNRELRQYKLKVTRQTVSKYIDDIGKELGYKRIGNAFKKVSIPSDF